MERFDQKKKINKQRLWAKTVKDEKITRNRMYDIAGAFDKKKLRAYLTDICHEWDIPTPMVLKMHENRLDEFNIVRFASNDFVEYIDFDVLILENAAED